MKNVGYDVVSDSGRAFKGFSRFRVRIASDNNGVKIRRRTTANGNFLQTANVYIDGNKVKGRPWHTLTATWKGDKQGWTDTDFDVPSMYTHGKERLTITVEYINSTKGEISEFYYWIYSYSNDTSVAGRLCVGGDEAARKRLRKSLPGNE